ncbi:MAG: FAD-binding domain-containing protein [Parvularculaceae bacterium]
MAQQSLFEDPPAAIDFAPTRAAGLSRLEAFAPRAGSPYARTRNYDYGPHKRTNVSALSPWIARRLIPEEEVLAATLARHSPSAAEKFVQEVFWRAYFKGWLEHRPDVWARYARALDDLTAEVSGDGGLRKAYDCATEGRTGIDCFDAWAAELVETGYLHNHARMWFASIWIFTLELPWELGADFFFRHLMDGDAASNTLSWRWVAGLHTKGKTYLARADNIEKYTDGRFRPKGLAGYAPALEEYVDESRTPLAQVPAELDEAVRDGALGVLLTDDDLSPDSLLGPDVSVAAVAGGTLAAARSPLETGARAMAFADGALDDALARAGAAFRAPTDRLDLADPSSLKSWAADHSLDAVVVPYPTQGPAAAAIRARVDALESAGVGVRFLRRRYDALAWPHATKGFFGLKKKLPAILDELGFHAAARD